MISRRKVIALGALTATPLAGLGARAAAAQGRVNGVGAGGTIHTVVYDDRYAESIQFGRQARLLGHRVSAISGDVTALWYDDLYHRWKQGPAAIAGMTTTGAAMCLQMFGADAGLRCVFEAEHRFHEGEQAVEHRVRSRADWSSPGMLQACGANGPKLMSAAMASCSAPSINSDHPVLVSWILTPAARASADV